MGTDEEEKRKKKKKNPGFLTKKTACRVGTRKSNSSTNIATGKQLHWNWYSGVTRRYTYNHMIYTMMLATWKLRSLLEIDSQFQVSNTSGHRYCMKVWMDAKFGAKLQMVVSRHHKDNSSWWESPVGGNGHCYWIPGSKKQLLVPRPLRSWFLTLFSSFVCWCGVPLWRKWLSVTIQSLCL